MKQLVEVKLFLLKIKQDTKEMKLHLSEIKQI